MMNIWLISKYASLPEYARAPSRLFYLAKEFYQLGNKPFLITSDSNHLADFPESKEVYNDEIQHGVPIRWIKTLKYRKTASFKRIISWLDFEKKLFFMNYSDLPKPEVVIVSSLSIFTIIYGYYLKKKFRCFLVFEIRDIWPLTMTEEAGFFKWHPLVLLIGWIEKFGYKKADLVVGTMPRLHEHIRKILGSEKPFFCSPLGFDSKDYTQEKSKNENPFLKLVPSNKIIVGYAGSMGVTNALDSFIKTIQEMRSEQKIHFLLVGSGDRRSKYENHLKEYTNVTFLEKIPQNEVKLFLEVCDILYLSTHSSKVWSYGQSMNKVVEYMLSGKPIVASYSGYPSMINEAGCGLFVNSESSEEIKKSLLYYSHMNKEQRIKIGENGRKWIYENRTYSLLAKQYLDAILKYFPSSKS